MALDERTLRQELSAVKKQEKKLTARAQRENKPTWKAELQKKVPKKVYNGLESAFCKGFELLFSQGTGLIEKSYNREEIQKDQAIRDFAVRIKGGKKELRQMHKSAKKTDFRNLAVTTAEGVGLGALGIGMPDVVLFLSTVLKGVYETALNYGYDYSASRERLLILKLLAASISNGELFVQLDREVEELLQISDCAVTEEELQAQIRETASVFALDMLVLKFIQGMPVIGIVGGLSNPVYYRKIMRYVQLKYRKRYLMNLDEEREP